MELIERVARSILASSSGSALQWDDMDIITRGSLLSDAKAAIRAMLDGVESNLSAVQYDPAPYTAMKHRIAAMRKDVE